MIGNDAIAFIWIIVQSVNFPSCIAYLGCSEMEFVLAEM